MWSDRKCAGLALGALLWDDRALDAVADTLPAAALATASERLSELTTDTTPEQKRRLVRALVDEVRGGPPAVQALPPRAGALLARHVPRELGRRLVAEAPTARPDFDAPSELVQTILRLARQHAATTSQD